LGSHSELKRVERSSPTSLPGVSAIIGKQSHRDFFAAIEETFNPAAVDPEPQVESLDTEVGDRHDLSGLVNIELAQTRAKFDIVEGEHVHVPIHAYPALLVSSSPPYRLARQKASPTDAYECAHRFL
jgi:hypothetical protein